MDRERFRTFGKNGIHINRNIYEAEGNYLHRNQNFCVESTAHTPNLLYNQSYDKSTGKNLLNVVRATKMLFLQQNLMKNLINNIS